ncbi:prephenate dehydratase [Solidesulfovibrio magneticus]|uniref:Bifunctional chorismate mutase/prephenate dehydratase n=1 Tax=Solidesulfovibrio magneticus (strain ATCC 700980 / DSM 13731 / RS-1) TaxID=573370 RepID=C4XI64_SOLM1|nr:prephenate dehydratase [Solidesulfovibrio magneticus]BAH74026.1 chorismate mutase/prephenate dehydratase [Solidesulfovibrio magneticus RS-1]
MNPDTTQPAVAPGSLEEALLEIRHGIDAVDDEIVALLNKRAALSLEVGRRKDGRASAIFKPFREQEVLARLTAANPGPLPNNHLIAVYREILSSSRRLQRPERVAYLGPEGTFSHFAAMAALGHSPDFLPQTTIGDVFAAVAGKQADLGVVPLENSLQGTIGQSLDNFQRYNVFIQAEITCRVSHALLSTATSLDAVEIVYSHPQPLAQCAGWLKTHLPRAKVIPTDSTAAAAARLAGEPNAAAIGHLRLAAMHHLNVLASPIEDLPDNWTRFFIIGPEDTKQQTRDKTSLLFTVPNKPGSLHQVLAHLAGEGINLTKLESRPIRGEKWQYFFFADLQCDLTREEYKKLLATLTENTHSLRILGCYPAGPQVDLAEGATDKAE